MTNEKLLKKLHEQYDDRFEKIIKTIKKYSKNSNIEMVNHAYNFGLDAHKKQRRYSGEPYFDHCLNVAEILADLKMDSVTITAGILHDVVEDTGVDLQEISDKFGVIVSNLVDGVTKIGELKFQSKEQRQAETFRKMLVSMASDVRVIIIKFADRLHNMRTLEHVPQKNRERIAIETRDVYAPLAHRFGIAKIKWELEDLVLKYLDDESYQNISRKVNQSREVREKYIRNISMPIEKELKKVKIKVNIVGRAKHYYSIYNKMQRQKRPFEDIYDLLALRIIVNKVEECYYTLGVVHNLYHPIYDRFKDYIAMPKMNGYQSLHTTVFGPDGKMIEIQIRTEEMHKTAEIGIAAHWLYKEGNSDEELDQHMTWIRSLLDTQQDERDPKDFMEHLKIDLFQDEAFIFTPKGDLFKLPFGSTPIDFAFAIHTDVGMHCIGAKVNGKIVPLKSELKSGDQVEIITSNNQEPHQDWLSFVKTSKARTRIKRYLREIQQDQISKLGEEMLTKYLKKYDLDINSPEFKDILPDLGFQNINSLYLSLGKGELTIDSLLKKLFPETVPKEKKDSFFTKYVRRARSKTGIRVQGMNNIAINFGQCCQPVPGDKISGFITQGKGITIHRIDCKNMLNLAQNTDKKIDVQWDIEEEQSFDVHLSILAEDRKDLLHDVSLAISRFDTNITMIEFKVDDSLAKGNLIVQVRDLFQLTKILNSLRKIKNIISVERVEKSVM
ncbi:RelA/SpoT family protein [Calditrichota bacterium]